MSNGRNSQISLVSAEKVVLYDLIKLEKFQNTFGPFSVYVVLNKKTLEIRG